MADKMVTPNATIAKTSTVFTALDASDYNSTTSTTGSSSGTTANATIRSCVNGQQWIYHHLDQCLETPAQFFAFSVGMAAIGLWMVAHLFLFKARRADPNWTFNRLGIVIVASLGSLCNLIGATLCDQLETQVLMGCYLVFSDVVFFLQWLYEWNKNRRLNSTGLSFYVTTEDWKSPDKKRQENAMNGGGALVLCLCLPWIMTVFYWPIRLSVRSPLQRAHSDQISFSPGGRKLLMVTDSSADNFGYALGFVALFLYAACKIPTIISIARHKAGSGESVSSSSFVIAANVFYFISIVAYDTDTVFLTNALPWLLTSVSLIGLACGIICLEYKNRDLGPNTRPSGRRRADGRYLLNQSEESLNSDLERSVVPRNPADNGSTLDATKLPSIQEEPYLEHNEEEQASDKFAKDDDYDAETASIHSRASDYILDDDDDVYVRQEENAGKQSHYDDDGLEWDFNDFRPKYTDPENEEVHNVTDVAGSPHHLTLGVSPIDGEFEDGWDEEKVLDEIERELQLVDDIDGDTISMEYDTAEDDEQFYQMNYK